MANVSTNTTKNVTLVGTFGIDHEGTDHVVVTGVSGGDLAHSSEATNYAFCEMAEVVVVSAKVGKARANAV